VYCPSSIKSILTILMISIVSSCAEDEPVKHDYALDQLDGRWRFERLEYEDVSYDLNHSTAPPDACVTGYAFSFEFTDSNNIATLASCSSGIGYYNVNLGPQVNHLQFQNSVAAGLLNFKILSLNETHLVLELRGKSGSGGLIGSVYYFFKY
jgi:hypothetical protein